MIISYEAIVRKIWAFRCADADFMEMIIFIYELMFINLRENIFAIHIFKILFNLLMVSLAYKLKIRISKKFIKNNFYYSNQVATS